MLNQITDPRTFAQSNLRETRHGVMLTFLLLIRLASTALFLPLGKVDVPDEILLERRDHALGHRALLFTPCCHTSTHPHISPPPLPLFPQQTKVQSDTAAAAAAAPAATTKTTTSAEVHCGRRFTPRRCNVLRPFWETAM